MAQIFNVFLESMKNMAGLMLSADWNEITLQSISVAVLHINPKGLIHQVNRFASDLFHLAPERFVGMALSELLEDTPKILTQLLTSFQRSDVTTLPSVSICTSRDLKAREDAKVTITVVPVTGQSPGYVLVLHPLNS
jgi:nitrogen-specific signal transduction histidine kinase